MLLDQQLMLHLTTIAGIHCQSILVAEVGSISIGPSVVGGLQIHSVIYPVVSPQVPGSTPSAWTRETTLEDGECIQLCALAFCVPVPNGVQPPTLAVLTENKYSCSLGPASGS